MLDWLGDVISEDVTAVYEDHYFTEDALFWFREKPRTFGELHSEEIDWLRWMAANIQDKDILEKLSRGLDIDVRMWVACNPLTPRLILEKLAEDPIVYVRRGVAQNKSTPCASADKAKHRSRHQSPNPGSNECENPLTHLNGVN